MTLAFHALDTETVAHLRAGEPDSNGQVPERHTCESAGIPCRHCLKDIEIGNGMLALGHRPFRTVQPYAECGPIFVCADGCDRHVDNGDLPPVMTARPRFIIRGYTADERIRYGTGDVVATPDIEQAAHRIFEDPEIAFIHVRSVQNNCYFCRIERG